MSQWKAATLRSTFEQRAAKQDGIIFARNRTKVAMRETFRHQRDFTSLWFFHMRNYSFSFIKWLIFKMLSIIFVGCRNELRYVVTLFGDVKSYVRCGNCLFKLGLLVHFMLYPTIAYQPTHIWISFSHIFIFIYFNKFWINFIETDYLIKFQCF